MTIATPPLARRKKLLGALIETTSGTLNDPSAALAMTITNAKMEPDGFFAEGPRRGQGNYFGTTDRPIEVQKAKLTFDFEAAHADAVITLLQGCGFTANTAGLVATPTSSIGSMSTLSFKLWEDGREKTMIGAMGNMTFKGTNGKKLMGSGEFSGVWVGTTAEAMPALAPITTIGYRLASVTLTFGGAALPLVSDITINLGAEAEERETVLNAQAIFSYLVTDRNPTIQIDPEARLVADHDSLGGFKAGTTGAVVATFVDPAGNSLTFNAARTQRVEISDGERGGKLTDPITLECHNSSGNDDLVVTKVAA
jgi:hypothetical protein